MKAKCIVPITVERKIICAYCDHCVEQRAEEKKKFWEWVKNWEFDFSRTKTVFKGYYCGLLEKPIMDVESEDVEDAPCKFEEWIQTNDAYELEYEVFTLQFKDGILSPIQLAKTEGELVR